MLGIEIVKMVEQDSSMIHFLYADLGQTEDTLSRAQPRQIESPSTSSESYSAPIGVWIGSCLRPSMPSLGGGVSLNDCMAVCFPRPNFCGILRQQYLTAINPIVHLL